MGTGGGSDGTARDGSAGPPEATPELVALLELIRRYMAELDWSYNVMGRRTNASSSSWNRWYTQKKLPRREAVVSFADAAPRVVDRQKLLGLWDAAWEAQEARQAQTAEQEPRQAQAAEQEARQAQAAESEPAEEQPREPRPDRAGHAPVPPAPAITTAKAPPAPSGRRRVARRLLLPVVAVAVAGGAFLVWSLGADADDSSGTQGAPPAASVTPVSSGGPQPSPTISCHGTACTSLEPARSICAEDAVTAYTGNKYGALIELRHSARCGAAWAKMSKTSAGDRVVITPERGNAEEYRQQYGHDAHTRMVAAESPEDARACAMIQDRGTVCATEPAVPGASPG